MGPPGIIGGHKLLYRPWELNSGPLQQQMVSPAEP